MLTRKARDNQKKNIFFYKFVVSFMNSNRKPLFFIFPLLLLRGKNDDKKTIYTPAKFTVKSYLKVIFTIKAFCEHRVSRAGQELLFQVLCKGQKEIRIKYSEET